VTALPRLAIDHIVWGAPDLESGMAAAERLFGALPVLGGSHPGIGTRNALLGLADGRYLEILAPDPAQPLAGTLGQRLADLSHPALVTWAVACPDLPAVAHRLQAAGLTTRGPVRLQRNTPAGEPLEWDLLFAGGHSFGALFPFFIHWRGTPHPSLDLAPVAALEGLTLESPHARALRRLLGNLDVPLSVVESPEPALRVTLETTHGPLALETVPAALDLRFG
jgi:hypothetical protein